MSIHTNLKSFPEVPITEADAAGFAAKLEAWYETLAPGEQAVLQRLLVCAESGVSEEGEVEGYAVSSLGARLSRILSTGLLGATLAAPLAATLFLAVHAGPRAALRFAGLGALAGGGLFAALDLATRHQLYRHTVGDRRLPWQPQLVLNFGALFLRDYWPLLAAAVLAAIALVLARAVTVAPYYLLAALLFLPTVGVVGADHDHLIELALASSLATGAGIGVLAGLAAARRRLAWAAYPLAALLLAQVATAWTPDRWYAG